MNRTECDVLVVGAGIVGLGHALAAADDGLSVLVIDRDSEQVGASVRNFGHVCATGQSGILRDLALGARDRWLSIVARAALPVVVDAGAVVARSADELAVVEELSARRDSVTMLTTAQARERLGGAGDDGIVGGAALGDDLRVDPRTAAPTVSSWLATRDNVEFSWRTSYLGTEQADDGGVLVRTTRGEVRADRVYVCVGHDLDHVAPTTADDGGVQRCALQMMLVDDPGVRIAPAVLTATSLLRYGAFAETDAARVLHARLISERAELLAADTNIMFTQRPDGTLLVGDSHVLDATTSPFLDEATSEMILREVETVLARALTVRQRWQGVYASRSESPYLTAELAPNVHACSVTTGVGMTVGLELAARHVAGTLPLPTSPRNEES